MIDILSIDASNWTASNMSVYHITNLIIKQVSNTTAGTAILNDAIDFTGKNTIDFSGLAYAYYKGSSAYTMTYTLSISPDKSTWTTVKTVSVSSVSSQTKSADFSGTFDISSLNGNYYFRLSANIAGEYNANNYVEFNKFQVR